MGIVVFLSGIAILNFWLYAIANDSSEKSKFIEDSPYERGLAYQENVDKEAAFVNLGLQAELLAQEDSLKKQIIFSLRYKTGKPISDAKITLRALRPDSEKLDQYLELLPIPDSPGKYQSDFPGPGGLWLGNFSIRLGSVALEFKKRFSFS